MIYRAFNSPVYLKNKNKKGKMKMIFLIMINKEGKVLRHLLSDNGIYKKDLVYEMLSRYQELGFMWVDFVVITRY